MFYPFSTTNNNNKKKHNINNILFLSHTVVSVYVRQTTANVQPLQLPIKRSARSDSGNGDLLTSEIGDDESDDDKQASRCCSILISSEKISQQSMQNLAKFIFIIYEQLGQLMPIEEIQKTKIKRSINTLDTANSNQISPTSDRTQSASAFSMVVSEIVSVFSQKESSVYSLPNSKADDPEPYIELTFNHNKLGLQENLTNYRCVQLQDSETIAYTMNSNNRVLSVEQAAFAVRNEQVNQPGTSQVSSTDIHFLAQSSACQTLHTNSTQTTCRCSSLGTFTVLADFGSSNNGYPTDIQNRYLMLKLNRICMFFCAICAILLLITIVSFYFHKSNLRSTKTINQLLFLRNNQSQLPGHLPKAINYQNILLSDQAKINYLICLLFLQCAMLISLALSESAQNNQVFCRLASLAIHYFVLTVFSWLLFDCFISSYLLVFTESKQHQQNQATNYSFNQAQPLVVLNANGFTTTTTTSSLDLRNSARQYTLRTCKLLTYLLPLFIVVLSSWIDPASYCSKSWRLLSTSIQQSSNELYAICWHSFDNIYIMFFVVPLIALLLAAIVFIVVSIALRLRMKHLTAQQSNKQFTFLTNNCSEAKPQQATHSKHNLFASNTRLNLFNILITTCCWLSASFYLNTLLETFESVHFNGQLIEQSTELPTYTEPLLTSNSIARSFTQLPGSNLALFAFLFALFNIMHCLVLLIKLGIREGLISSFCVQFINLCSFRSKQHSLNNISQLYMPPNYCYTDNQTSSADLDTLKFDQKQFNLTNKFEQQPNGSLKSPPNQLKQQPLIPPPQLIAKKYQLNQQQTYNPNLMSKDDEVYENDDQQHFSEQQSTSETLLASDLQASEQSDSEQFLVRNQNASFNDQYGNPDFLLKKNKVYGQNSQKPTNGQMENFYECIEENGQFYEPMIYSAAYGEHQQAIDYQLQTRLLQNKYNRLMNNQQQNFSDVESSEYENPLNPIERFNSRTTRTTNKLLRNYSSNDFLNERDAQSRLDQPLLPAIVRDNSNNYPQFGLSSTNHRNFSPLKSNRFNPTNSSFSSTIGRNVLLQSGNGLRNSSNQFRTTNKQTKEMINEQEQNLKQIQQQLKQFQMQLAMSSSQNHELKDHNKFDLNGQSAQQNSYLSSNSSVSDNVNSSV